MVFDFLSILALGVSGDAGQAVQEHVKDEL
jgi:hypothetical protein